MMFGKKNMMFDIVGNPILDFVIKTTTRDSLHQCNAMRKEVQK